ncbi:hypothetical protein MKW92_031979 [Papaver armeniacum]|nr:hypothetical protein MKW92_031979 [Papaver armeniacum]
MDTEGVVSSPSHAQTAQVKYVQELAISGEEPPLKYIQKDIVNVKGNQVTIDDCLWLPIIDVSRLTTNASIEEKEEEMEKLKSALKSWGMFQGMLQSLLDDMYNVSKQFSDLPVEEKQRYASSKDDAFSDFHGLGCDSVLANIDDDQVFDWYDYLNLLIEPAEERRLRYWPGDDSPLHFRYNTNKMKYKFQYFILYKYNISLGLEENDLVHQLDRKIVHTQINFYPPCSRPDLVYGIRPQTDAGAITILLQDPKVEGLQVHTDDQWVCVPCMPGALVVNIWDQLQIITNGIFKSPVHRAMRNTERTRISLAMFYAAQTDEEIEPVAALIDGSNPRKYRKLKVKDFLDAFDQNYLQGK